MEFFQFLLVFVLISKSLGFESSPCSTSFSNIPYPDEDDCLHSFNLLFCVNRKCTCLPDNYFGDSYFKTEWNEAKGKCVGKLESSCDHLDPGWRNKLECGHELFCEAFWAGDDYEGMPPNLPNTYILHGTCVEEYDYKLFIIIGASIGAFMVICVGSVGIWGCIARRRRKKIVERHQLQVQSGGNQNIGFVQTYIIPANESHPSQMEKSPNSNALGFEGLNQNGQ